MKKAQFLFVAVAAVLMLPTAFAVCLDFPKNQSGWSTISSFAQVAGGSPLPDLCESVASRSPDTPGEHSDNTTINSGGVVRASFTVVSQPADSQEASMTAEVQAMPDNRAYTTAHVRPESGGLTLRWVLLTTACSVSIAALSGLAFLRFRAKAQTSS